MDCFISDTETTTSCPSDGEQLSSYSSRASSREFEPWPPSHLWSIDEDDGFAGEFPVMRGWSMRRGHLKRLVMPKTGRAATRAELHGQGKEVSRGRSIFKRSVNSNSQYWNNVLDKNHVAKARANVRSEIAFELLSMSEIEESCWDSESQDWAEQEDTDNEYNCYNATEGDEQQHAVCSNPGHDNIHVKPTRRASSAKAAPFHALACRLTTVGGVIVEDDLPKSMSTFQEMQWRFLQDYGVSCCDSLQKCYPGRITLSPTSLCDEVQQRFLSKRDALGDCLKPAFHGTLESNLKSICKKGLLIPGKGNHLRVANGSAHGLGVYTAKLRNPHLSFGYCRGSRKMLICGVLDDCNPDEPYWYKGTGDVLHAGDATIFFDESRVAPLFQASLDGGEIGSINGKRTVEFDWDRHARILLRIQDYRYQLSHGKRDNSHPVTHLDGQSKMRGPAAFLGRRAVRRRWH